MNNNKVSLRVLKLKAVAILKNRNKVERPSEWESKNTETRGMLMGEQRIMEKALP